MCKFLQCIINLCSFLKKKEKPSYDRERHRVYRERIRKKYNLNNYRSL